MRRRREILRAFFLLLASGSMPVHAVEPSGQRLQPAGEQVPEARPQQKPVEASSGAERMLRVKEVIELDRLLPVEA